MLARGKVSLPLMPLDWTQPNGVSYFVDDLAPLLKRMLGSNSRLPRIVVSDRGPGLYQASSGTIVASYKEALERNGFTPFAGNEAK